MVLKPIDLFLIVKIALLKDEPWTQKQIADALSLNLSDVNNSIRRCEASHLLDRASRKVRRKNLEEFVFHGAKYAFPAEFGRPTIGLPTSYAAPPISKTVLISGDIPVWPDAEGPNRGYEFAPLHKSAVAASRRDPNLYEMLALVDAIRDGRARETAIARDEMAKRLRS